MYYFDHLMNKNRTQNISEKSEKYKVTSSNEILLFYSPPNFQLELMTFLLKLLVYGIIFSIVAYILSEIYKRLTWKKLKGEIV